MFCKNCGSKLGDNQKFCMKCGAKINVENSDTLNNQNLSYSIDKNVDDAVLKNNENSNDSFNNSVNKNNNVDVEDNYFADSGKAKNKVFVGLMIAFLILIVLIIAGGFFAYKSGFFDDMIGVTNTTDSYENNDISTNAIENKKYKKELVNIDGELYYYDENGEKACDKVIEVDNNKYYFDKTGKSKRNYIYNLQEYKLYFGKDGKLVYNDWVQIDDKYYYAKSEGQFANAEILKVDGEYYAFNDDCSLICDYFLENGDKSYYFKSDGSAVKNDFYDVNGFKKYFGEDAVMVKSDWILYNGMYFHVDANGNVETNKIIDKDYYVNQLGVMVVNAWVNGHYYGADGKMYRNMYTPDGKLIDGNGNIVNISVPKTTTQPPTQPPTMQQPVTGFAPQQTFVDPNGSNIIISPTEVSPENGVTNNNSELYIARKLRITETFDTSNSNYTCNCSITKPVMGGKDSGEVDAFNDQIDGIIDELSESLEGYCGSASPIPKSISFTKVEVSTLTTRKCRITMTAKVTPRSGSSKTLKYRIEFDRETATAVLESL